MKKRIASRFLTVALLAAAAMLFPAGAPAAGNVAPEAPEGWGGNGRQAPLALMVQKKDDDALGDFEFQLKVNDAISRGVAYLKGLENMRIRGHGSCPYGNNLALLTLIHVDRNEDGPLFKSLLEKALTSELKWVYDTSLIAMSLEELDRVRYQDRIHQCAQYLADNIGPEGQVHYGKATEMPEEEEKRKDVETASSSESKKADGEKGTDGKPLPVRTIKVTQKRMGVTEFDHSNVQYYALGLRACHDAGIRFDPKIVARLEYHLRKYQIKESNAKKEPLLLDVPARSGRGSTRSQMMVPVAPAPWDYNGKGNVRASMVAGSVGALCICDYILGKDWRKDMDVMAGLQWINKNFSVTENIGDKHDGAWYYYYMYGLERAGMLFGTETIGQHRWYLEGAKELLKIQKPNGSWDPVGGVKDVGWGDAVRDTCFAILFLKRATHRLENVATGRNR